MLNEKLMELNDLIISFLTVTNKIIAVGLAGFIVGIYFHKWIVKEKSKKRDPKRRAQRKD